MFEQRWAWVGGLLGAAAVAYQTYRRGSNMWNRDTTPDYVREMRDGVWRDREQFIDMILLHDCQLHDLALDILAAIGWDPDLFILCALRGDRGGLDA